MNEDFRIYDNVKQGVASYIIHQFTRVQNKNYSMQEGNQILDLYIFTISSRT